VLKLPAACLFLLSRTEPAAPKSILCFGDQVISVDEMPFNSCRRTPLISKMKYTFSAREGRKVPQEAKTDMLPGVFNTLTLSLFQRE
jgi:hypothetical protein